MTTKCRGLMVLLLATCSSLLWLSTLQGQAAGEVLLSMPEPPEGYGVLKQRIADNADLGWNVVMVKENSPHRIVISVATAQNLTSQAARLAAAKGYINGAVETLQGAGFTLTDSKLPDIGKSSFTKPIGAQFSFKQPDGSKLSLRQIIFFTDKGYHIQIGSTDAAELDMLTKWAMHVKPAASSRK